MQTSELINLTGQPITIVDGIHVITIQSQGLFETTNKMLIENLKVRHKQHYHYIPLKEAVAKVTITLPEERPNTYYIVNEETAMKFKERKDFLTVGEPIFDENNKIIGHKNLVKL